MLRLHAAFQYWARSYNNPSTTCETHLDSGNAVIHAANGVTAGHAAAIAAGISSRLGIAVPVIVKSTRELDAIIAEDPIAVAAAEHSRLLVAFARAPRALEGLAAIEPLVRAPEKFAMGRHAAFLYCSAGIPESRAVEALLGKAGKESTTRNRATVLKLQALAGASRTREESN